MNEEKRLYRNMEIYGNIEIAKNKITKNPNDKIALKTLAWDLYGKSGNDAMMWKKDAELWHEVILHEPENEFALMNYAHALEKSGDIDQAISIYDKISKMNISMSVKSLAKNIIRSYSYGKK